MPHGVQSFTARVSQGLLISQAVNRTKMLRAKYANFLDQFDHVWADEKLKAAQGVLTSGLVTRFECIVGRACLKLKNKKNTILSAKGDFEERALVDPVPLMNERLWQLAEKHIK